MKALSDGEAAPLEQVAALAPWWRLGEALGQAAEDPVRYGFRTRRMVINEVARLRGQSYNALETVLSACSAARKMNVVLDEHTVAGPRHILALKALFNVCPEKAEEIKDRVLNGSVTVDSIKKYKHDAELERNYDSSKRHSIDLHDEFSVETQDQKFKEIIKRRASVIKYFSDHVIQSNSKNLIVSEFPVDIEVPGAFVLYNDESHEIGAGIVFVGMPEHVRSVSNLCAFAALLSSRYEHVVVLVPEYNRDKWRQFFKIADFFGLKNIDLIFEG